MKFPKMLKDKLFFWTINNFPSNFICILFSLQYAAYTESLVLNKNRYPQAEVNTTAQINVIRVVFLLKAAAKYFQNRNFKIKEQKKKKKGR